MILTNNQLKKHLVTHLQHQQILINTISEEEDKVIIDDIKKNREKIYEQDECSKFIIQPTYKRGDLLNAIKIILNFNKVLSLDDNNYG